VSVVSVVDESARAEIGGFYVPAFELRIAGSQLPGEVLRDVHKVVYRDNIAELDSFELVVNNWDPATRAFRYVGSETSAQLRRKEGYVTLFEPCNKTVELRMGYRDELRTMLTGTFTTMEPTFPSSGAPTLTVRGLNVLHQLRRKPYSNAWENKRDSEIAQQLATLRDPDSGRKRFPLPIEVDRNALGREPVIEYVAQDNVTDIDFLMMRALERGYVVFVKPEDPERRQKERLYFGPSEGDRAGLRNVTYELAWGRSILELKPTLTTAHQVRSVTVRGWDRNKKEPIEAKVDLDDPALNRNRDLYDLLKVCDPRDDVVVNQPVFTKRQAERRARDLLRERQKHMVQVTAKTIGLPDLRAGQVVAIQGVGARFSGLYFVTATTHMLDDTGYTTEFNARREDDGSQGAG
jgi:phage protein D